MSGRRIAMLVLVTLGPLIGAGCRDPYASTDSPLPPPRTQPADSQAPMEPNQTARPRRTTRRGRGAAETAAAYARAAGNWSWRTYRDQYAHLRSLAAGNLARQLDSAPPDRDVLRGLAAERQAARAKVIAVDRIGDGNDIQRVVVVLAESVASRGAPEGTPRHNVYRAKLLRTSRGWLVTAWELLP